MFSPADRGMYGHFKRQCKEQPEKVFYVRGPRKGEFRSEVINKFSKMANRILGIRPGPNSNGFRETPPDQEWFGGRNLENTPVKYSNPPYDEDWWDKGMAVLSDRTAALSFA